MTEREWMPIETAPKDDEEKLLWVKDDGMCIGGFDLCHDRWRVFEGGYFFIEPTHWMPLPAPPKSGATP